MTDTDFADVDVFLGSPDENDAFVTIVPEPGEPWLAGAGALALWLARRARRS